MHRAIDLIIHRHSFWRHIKFTELSELYMSVTLRVLGLSLIGIFVPVYLYESGYQLESIALLYSATYLIRLLIDPIVAKSVDLLGPRHVIRFSFIVEILFLTATIAVGNDLAPMWIIAPLFAVMTSCFFLPFHADFSSFRSAKKVGKQLGSLTILEKTAGALGPLFGGLIATYYGFEVTLLIATVVTLIAAVPLYMTNEHGNDKKFHFKFTFDIYLEQKKEFLATVGRGATISNLSIFWPLFIALIVVGDNVYSGLGAVTAAGLVASMVSAYAIGQLVDSKKGRKLLRYGAVGTTVLNLFRPVVSSIGGATVLSVVSEPLESAVNMPFMKGVYSEANSSKNGRVAYMVGLFSILHITRAVFFAYLYFLLINFEVLTALTIAMLTAGILSALIATEKYKALDA